MKKYAFTGDTKQHRTVTVKQIRRLSDGALGGWIEKEENLSHDGDCWVCDSAIVYGSARVYGSAIVCDNARVYGSARVYGRARVYDSATVYDSARVYGSARVYDSARVCNSARVYDSARVCNSAGVYGSARVYDSATVYGRARVCDTARVYGSARVCDNAGVYVSAIVYGNATVYNSARVCGSAIVYGSARVCDSAVVYGSARVYGSAIVCSTAGVCDSAVVSRGSICFNFTGDTDSLRQLIQGSLGLLPDPQGNYLVYKYVKKINNVYKSCFSENFVYTPKAWVVAKDADPDPSVCCGRGLHFSHPTYWSEGDCLLQAYVRFEDIITCLGGKLRVKQAFIIGEVKL